MKRINKVLLALVLTFGLFMVCDLTYADQMGPCSNDVCTLSVEKVDSIDTSLVNPEFFSLGGWETLYAVSISSDDSFIWNGQGVLKFGAIDVNNIKQYVPVGSVGSVGSNIQDGYLYVSTTQDPIETGSNTKIIGYLVTGDVEDLTVEFASGEFYSNDYGTNVTVNGIKSMMNNDYIDVDLFFGDFQYNFVLTSDYDSDNYWEPVNKNSGQITIDNTDSIADLNCNLHWDTNVSSVGLRTGESITGVSSYGVGDAVITLDRKNSNYSFKAALGSKTEFDILPDGGDEESVKSILSKGGTLGRLSLSIFTNEYSI